MKPDPRRKKDRTDMLTVVTDEEITNIYLER